MKISREENLQLTNDDNFRRIVREEEEVFSMADVGANICGKVSHYACRDVRIVVDRLPDLGQKMSPVRSISIDSQSWEQNVSKSREQPITVDPGGCVLDALWSLSNTSPRQVHNFLR